MFQCVKVVLYPLFHLCQKANYAGWWFDYFKCFYDVNSITVSDISIVAPISVEDSTGNKKPDCRTVYRERGETVTVTGRPGPFSRDQT